MSKHIFGFLLCTAALCAQADKPAAKQNTYALKPQAGSAELEWVSPSTFRFARRWSGQAPESAEVTATAVAVKVEDRGTRLRFTTRYITVEAEKDGSRIAVLDDRHTLTNTSVRTEGGKVVVENTAAASEAFYGLGSRRTAKLDLRGTKVESKRPFLVSGAGYGMFFPGAEPTFDLAASRADRMQAAVPGNQVEFFFYYGPTPKEVMEEHMNASGEAEDCNLVDLKPVAAPRADAKSNWDDLRDTTYAFQHESMSAMRVPSLDISRYRGEVFLRAAQLGALIPKLQVPEPCDSKACAAMLERRARLTPYLQAYGYEARVRGTPVIHPLAVQFSRDADGAKRTNEFMVGDELLVAPVLSAGATSVPVYFPPGIWTDLRTNATYPGRKEVAVPITSDDLPLFTRNGMIVPLASEVRGGPMELHYFPKLGAEFFLFEEDLNDITQVHAAPSVDFLRLEIESLKNRGYEWIVHHTPQCKRVMQGDSEFLRVDDRTLLVGGTWYYDAAQQNLHVRVQATTRGDEIINISF